MESNEKLVKLIKAGIDINDNMLKLWKNSEGLIFSIIKRYAINDSIDDLMQESFIALYDIIEYFNPEHANFTTFLCFCLKRHLYRYIHEKGLLVRPEYIEQMILKYKRYLDEYEKNHAKKPSHSQIIQELHIDIKTYKYIEMQAVNNNITSLDNPINEEGNNKIIDLIGGENFEDNKIREIDSKECLKECINNLDQDEKNIIECRYVQNLSIQETGKKLDITEDEIKKIIKNTRYRLRKLEKVREYYNDYLMPQAYHHVSISKFNTTQTSITERVALKL